MNLGKLKSTGHNQFRLMYCGASVTAAPDLDFLTQNNLAV